MSTNPAQQIAELREYYDTTSTAEELADEAAGRWEDDVETDPMVTTSLRLPKSLLDTVRAEAKALEVKPTALIRTWIEQHYTAPQPGVQDEPHTLAERITRLERAVFVEHGTRDAG